MEQARALLQAGASIRARNAHDESVLHAALSTSKPSLETITWLVENGADVNWIGGRKRETPLLYAITNSSHSSYDMESKKIDHVEKLLSLGANVNFRNVNGATALSIASRKCSLALAKLLIQYGACIHSTDLDGKSHLHCLFDGPLVSSSRQREMIKFLIQKGADVNSRDCNGYTPLHRVVSKSWTWELAEELLKVGADRCAISNDGKYPYDMITDGPFAETQRLILRHYPA